MDESAQGAVTTTHLSRKAVEEVKRSPIFPFSPVPDSAYNRVLAIPRQGKVSARFHDFQSLGFNEDFDMTACRAAFSRK